MIEIFKLTRRAGAGCGGLDIKQPEWALVLKDNLAKYDRGHNRCEIKGT